MKRRGEANLAAEGERCRSHSQSQARGKCCNLRAAGVRSLRTIRRKSRSEGETGKGEADCGVVVVVTIRGGQASGMPSDQSETNRRRKRERERERNRCTRVSRRKNTPAAQEEGLLASRCLCCVRPEPCALLHFCRARGNSEKEKFPFPCPLSFAETRVSPDQN